MDHAFSRERAFRCERQNDTAAAAYQRMRDLKPARIDRRIMTRVRRSRLAATVKVPGQPA